MYVCLYVGIYANTRGQERLGSLGSEFIQSLRDRAKAKMEELFGVKRLYDSGALLTRLTADYQNDECVLDEALRLASSQTCHLHHRKPEASLTVVPFSRCVCCGCGCYL